jgi:hypothetical protein
VFDRVSQILSLDVFRKVFWHFMSLCSVVSGVSISHRRQFEKLGKNKWCALCSISFLLAGSKVCAGKVFLVIIENFHWEGRCLYSKFMWAWSRALFRIFLNNDFVGLVLDCFHEVWLPPFLLEHVELIYERILRHHI